MVVAAAPKTRNDPSEISTAQGTLFHCFDFLCMLSVNAPAFPLLMHRTLTLV